MQLDGKWSPLSFLDDALVGDVVEGCALPHPPPNINEFHVLKGAIQAPRREHDGKFFKS